MPENEPSVKLPGVVALCPVHAEEFYVPHAGACPEAGCDRRLVVYERAAVSGSTEDPNPPR